MIPANIESILDSIYNIQFAILNLIPSYQRILGPWYHAIILGQSQTGTAVENLKREHG